MDMLEEIGPALQRRELEATQGTRPPEWLLKLVYWAHDEQAAMISLNYDTLLERAFECLPVVRTNSREFRLDARALYPHQFPLDSPDGSKASWWPTAELLKLHGSLNWYYSGADAFFGETLRYLQVAPWGSGYTAGASGLSDKVPLIAPPLTDKSAFISHESLQMGWRRAHQVLYQAKRVFCIGFSFPPTDQAIRFLIADAFGNTKKGFYLVDIDDKLPSRVRSILPRGVDIALDFFGRSWPETLTNYLCRLLPKEYGYDRNAGITEAVKKQVRTSISPGLQIRTARGTYEVSRIDDASLSIRSADAPVPWVFTYRSLAAVIAHLLEVPGPLRIARETVSDGGECVEVLLTPWYARVCGQPAVAVMLRAEIVFLVADDMIGGLTPKFAQTLPPSIIT
ncbi:MAG: hypothetical protein SFV54_12740 [Bryobacteraceae bacterium]|nr:hypothetical protein [Bryobacteraceae bacterium]